MKRVFAYIFLFFVSSQIFGQASIKGTVTDASNGELLLGATILIENTTKGTMTDFDGNYLFENLPFGTYKIIARFLAYKSIEKRLLKLIREEVENFGVTPHIKRVLEDEEYVAKQGGDKPDVSVEEFDNFMNGR